MGVFVERVGLEAPVVQAGMAGGIAGYELAAAVSSAGGLGTIGTLPPDAMRDEIAAARRLTDRPLAVNLLLPLARRAHFAVARDADVVVTFWGRPERPAPAVWVHQCGSVDEALAAWHAGADAVIAQGVEAGGHVRGTVPAGELLAHVRAELPAGYPVLSAGGIVERDDVVARLAAGADAAVCGTRFLLADESGAHPEYKRRLLDSKHTFVTELFGAGWPAPHRVVANEATMRWLRDDQRGPRWMRAAHRATAPLLSRAPMSVQLRAAASQTPGRPLFGPAPATAGGPSNLVDAGPLYAGAGVDRVHDISPATELVRELAP